MFRSITTSRNCFSLPGAPAAAVILLLCLAQLPANGAGIEGFTEPYRQVEVASAETGIVTHIALREGNRVEQGQILARLNQEELACSLKIAAKQREAFGQLHAALAEHRLREERLMQLIALRSSDHATQEEVNRATAEKEVAQARVLAAQDVLQVKELEYDRIQTQLERRIIRSPVSGVVREVYKEEGEFVAPTDPIVLSVVQLDPLLATFSVPAGKSIGLKAEQPVRVQLTSDPATVGAKIECISPVINAQSGTVIVKVRFANPKERYRSGGRCMLFLPDKSSKLTRKP